jgi:hypothetical protein
MKVAIFVLDSGKRALLMRKCAPSLETTFFVAVLQLGTYFLYQTQEVNCDISRGTERISLATQ